MKVNLQTGDFRRRPSESAARSSYWAKLGILVQIGLVIVLAVGVCNAYIYLNQQISDTGAAIRRSRQNIHLAEREIAMLEVERERLSSWSHISSQIRKYNLGLRAAAPGQVKKLVIRMPVRSSDQQIARHD